MTYRIDGMTCGGCSASVSRALVRAGVEGAEVDHDRGTATVPDGVEASVVQKAVEGAGFTFVGPYADARPE